MERNSLVPQEMGWEGGKLRNITKDWQHTGLVIIRAQSDRSMRNLDIVDTFFVFSDWFNPLASAHLPFLLRQESVPLFDPASCLNRFLIPSEP